MNKTWKILRYELVSAVTRRSFLLISFGIPLVTILIFGILGILKNDISAGSDEETTSEGFDLKVEGYVDPSGLIQTIPSDLPQGILISYTDEESAMQARQAGEISAYYIIPSNHIESGEFIYVPEEINPFTGSGQDWIMRWTLLVNTLGGDAELASRVFNPYELKITNLTPTSSSEEGGADCLGYSCETNTLVSLLPLVMLVLFVVFISNGSGIMLRSISTEKQNRTMEVLLSSIAPRQMLNGKFIGLGLVSLIPTTLYLLTLYIVLRIGGDTLQLPPGFSLPTSMIMWSLVLFILGYAVYASLMAGLGALFPTQKEANQASIVVLLPLMAGYFLATTPFIQEDPQGLLATTLSIFPLTAPVVMVMRLATGDVPPWQILLALVLMAGTAVLVLRSTARMFRAQSLLSGQSFSVRQYLSVLFGRS